MHEDKYQVGKLYRFNRKSVCKTGLPYIIQDIIMLVGVKSLGGNYIRCEFISYGKKAALQFHISSPISNSLTKVE